MSQENVEVVRRIYEAFARGDLRVLLDSVDPAIRCYDRPSRPGADVYVGRIGFLRFWQSDREVFESVRYDPRKFTDADDHVVVPIRQSGRGKASRVPVEEDVVNVWKVQRGKAVALPSTRPNTKPSKRWGCETPERYEVSYPEGRVIPEGDLEAARARNRCHA